MRKALVSSRLVFRQVAAQMMVLVATLALLAGCVPPEPTANETPSAGPVRDGGSGARVNCYLTLRESEGPAVRFEIAAIEVLAGELWQPISSNPQILDSAVLGGGQQFLGSRAIPPGVYQKLRLTVTRGLARQDDGTMAVISADPIQVEVALADDLRLEQNDSRCLMLVWDVPESLEPAGGAPRPVLTVAPPLRQLPVDLVYAACPEIDTIFVVRVDKNWVVDSFGLKGQPTWLAIEPGASARRLYVLTELDRAVKVVDLSSQRVVTVFQVPLNDAPTYMTISADGRRVYLLDERSGYVSCIDLTSGRSLARVYLGYRPHYAHYLAEQNLLAVSLSLSQKVLLLDPVKLSVAASFSTGNAPQGLLAVGDRLYVVENGSHSVSSIDLASRGGYSRLAVGLGPRRLLATDNQIYVSNYTGGSLSVLFPGQLGVIQEIRGFGQPQEMVFNRFYRRIYVTDAKAAALAVVDVNSNLLLGRIPLGARPTSLAVIQ